MLNSVKTGGTERMWTSPDNYADCSRSVETADRHNHPSLQGYFPRT